MRLRISAGIAATLIALAVLGTAFLLTYLRFRGGICQPNLPTGGTTKPASLILRYRATSGPFVILEVSPYEVGPKHIHSDPYGRVRSGACPFRLGRQEVLDGELTRILTFYEPAEQNRCLEADLQSMSKLP